MIKIPLKSKSNSVGGFDVDEEISKNFQNKTKNYFENPFNDKFEDWTVQLTQIDPSVQVSSQASFNDFILRNPSILRAKQDQANSNFASNLFSNTFFKFNPTFRLNLASIFNFDFKTNFTQRIGSKIDYYYLKTLHFLTANVLVGGLASLFAISALATTTTQFLAPEQFKPSSILSQSVGFLIGNQTQTPSQLASNVTNLNNQSNSQTNLQSNPISSINSEVFENLATSQDSSNQDSSQSQDSTSANSQSKPVGTIKTNLDQNIGPSADKATFTLSACKLQFSYPRQYDQKPLQLSKTNNPANTESKLESYQLTSINNEPNQPNTDSVQDLAQIECSKSENYQTNLNFAVQSSNFKIKDIQKDFFCSNLALSTDNCDKIIGFDYLVDTLGNKIYNFKTSNFAYKISLDTIQNPNKPAQNINLGLNLYSNQPPLSNNSTNSKIIGNVFFANSTTDSVFDIPGRQTVCAKDEQNGQLYCQNGLTAQNSSFILEVPAGSYQVFATSQQVISKIGELVDNSIRAYYTKYDQLCGAQNASQSSDSKLDSTANSGINSGTESKNSNQISNQCIEQADALKTQKIILTLEVGQTIDQISSWNWPSKKVEITKPDAKPAEIETQGQGSASTTVSSSVSSAIETPLETPAKNLTDKK